MTDHPSMPFEVARRQLHFFWLVDYSASMQGAKIQALNHAIRVAIPEIRNALANHPEVEVLMRAIRFSETVEWHVGPKPVPLDQFNWPMLDVDAITNTGMALELLSTELDIAKMPKRGYPPVILLISDGFASDSDRYHAALKSLITLPWGKRAVRIAIGIGQDHQLDEAELKAFNSDVERPLLRAHNVAELVEQIKWASTAATVASSHGKSAMNDTQQNVILPPTPANIVQIDNGGDIF